MNECLMESAGVKLTASAVLAQIGPSAIGQTLPDLGSRNHPVAPADVLYLIVYWEHLHAADLHTHRHRQTHTERIRVGTPVVIYHNTDLEIL